MSEQTSEIRICGVNQLRLFADWAAKKWPFGQPIPSATAWIESYSTHPSAKDTARADSVCGGVNLTGSDETVDNAHLMRLSGRFSRQVRGYAKANGIPVIDCGAGQKKYQMAEEHLKRTKVTRGLFLILVGRAQAPVWDVSGKHRLGWKRPMPYVNHYSFHIIGPDWGHTTIKISGHPPFPAQVMLNGHEYVACQARKAGIRFTKERNCFPHVSNSAELASAADTLAEESAIAEVRHGFDVFTFFVLGIDGSDLLSARAIAKVDVV